MRFDPIFGEANQIAGYLDDMGNEWTVEQVEDYWDVSGNEPDGMWLDEDALNSVGWGVDESYGGW
jgi:hypothetical protein